MSTKAKDWYEVSRGDILTINGEDKIVSLAVKVGYYLLISFHTAEYVLIHEDDTLVDFEKTGHYYSGKSKQLNLKAR